MEEESGERESNVVHLKNPRTSTDKARIVRGQATNWSLGLGAQEERGHSVSADLRSRWATAFPVQHRDQTRHCKLASASGILRALVQVALR
jgi:hypothetical protein